LYVVFIGWHHLIQSLYPAVISSSHRVRGSLTKSFFNLPLQLFHRLKLFTFELRFQITEWKEVTWIDIMAVRRLMSMLELATFKTMFSDG
jgi:hypothetical protein